MIKGARKTKLPKREVKIDYRKERRYCPAVAAGATSGHFLRHYLVPAAENNSKWQVFLTPLPTIMDVRKMWLKGKSDP